MNLIFGGILLSDLCGTLSWAEKRAFLAPARWSKPLWRYSVYMLELARNFSLVVTCVARAVIWQVFSSFWNFDKFFREMNSRQKWLDSKPSKILKNQDKSWIEVKKWHEIRIVFSVTTSHAVTYITLWFDEKNWLQWYFWKVFYQDQIWSRSVWQFDSSVTRLKRQPKSCQNSPVHTGKILELPG